MASSRARPSHLRVTASSPLAPAQRVTVSATATSASRTTLLLSPSEALRQRLRSAALGSPHVSFRAVVAGEVEPRSPRFLATAALVKRASFLCGVATCALSVYFALVLPAVFGTWMLLLTAPLFAFRAWLYTRRKEEAFLADFCYFAFLLAVAVELVPGLQSNPRVFELLFMLANGPVLWAIPAWSNALVFHDPDRSTSFFLHFMPALLTLVRRYYYPAALAGRPQDLPPHLACLRPEDHAASHASWLWHGGIPGWLPRGLQQALGLSAPLEAALQQLESAAGKVGAPPATVEACDIDWWVIATLPLAFYALWQAAFLVYTECPWARGHRILRTDPAQLSSIRHMLRTQTGLLSPPVLALTRRVGLFGPTETFREECARSKAVFMVGQLLYTVVTLLPTRFFFRHYAAHTALLAAMAGVAVWNGSEAHVGALPAATLSTTTVEVTQVKAAAAAAVQQAAAIQHAQRQETGGHARTTHPQQEEGAGGADPARPGADASVR